MAVSTRLPAGSDRKPHRLDRNLNGLLAELSTRIGRSSARSAVLAPGDPGVTEDAISALLDAGLVAVAEPARSAVCDGCERSCPMPVEFESDGTRASHFIVCDKRDDIGRVPVPAAHLRRWRSSPALFAGAAASLLRTDRPPLPYGDAAEVALGEIQHGGDSVSVVLASVPVGVPGRGLTITLGAGSNADGAGGIAFPDLFGFRDGHLRLRESVLEAALSARFGDERIAAEILFEAGEVMLVNHVTGTRRILASPNFNSWNDNAFAVLFEQAGTSFRRSELAQEARWEGTVPSLHKLPENLGFDGVLKRVFFRVAKDAIRFDRTVTAGQLAALGIDPAAIG